MITTNSLQAGLSGIQAGLQMGQRSATQIAALGIQPKESDLGELTEALVGSIQAELQVAASAEVVKTSDDIMGTLLDVRA